MAFLLVFLNNKKSNPFNNISYLTKANCAKKLNLMMIYLLFILTCNTRIKASEEDDTTYPLIISTTCGTIIGACLTSCITAPYKETHHKETAGIASIPDKAIMNVRKEYIDIFKQSIALEQQVADLTSELIQRTNKSRALRQEFRNKKIIRFQIDQSSQTQAENKKDNYFLDTNIHCS
jgi:hypothetical protein